MNRPGLWELFWRFALYSLMAVGGASSLLPEIHRQVVDVGQWMSGAEFASLFAIGQVAPGPNVLIVSLIGWKVAGIPGALVCTIGICLPSSLLAFQAGKLWYRFADSPWRKALEMALAPITVGLVLGSSGVLASLNGQAWLLYAITIATAAASYCLRLNPLWWLAAAAVLGMAFL